MPDQAVNSNAPQLSALVFDMDGVLVASEAVWARVLEDVAELNGSHFTDADRLEVFGCSDEHENVVLARVTGLSVEEAAQAKADYLIEHPVSYAGIEIDGIHALLGLLHELGIRAGIASSSSIADVRRMMGECGFERDFDVAVGGDEVPAAKPEPFVYLRAAELLGVDPATSIAVEDSPCGCQAALAAGFRVVQLDVGGIGAQAEGLYAVCGSHAEIASLVRDVVAKGNL